MSQNPLTALRSGACASGRRAGAGAGRRDERGAVAAETMVVLPVLVAVAVLAAWLVGLAATQVRVVDAARETARALARHETHAVAVAAGRKVAPADAGFTVAAGETEVRVRVAARVRVPGGLGQLLPPVTVSAKAVAAPEPK